MYIGNSLFWSQSIVSDFLPGVRDTSASPQNTDCYTEWDHFCCVVRRHQSTDIRNPPTHEVSQAKVEIEASYFLHHNKPAFILQNLTN